MVGLSDEHNLAPPQALLQIVAEEIKLPLTQIVRRLELARLGGEPAGEALVEVETSAAVALKLMDSYMLGVNLAENQQTLELEPVSVSAALYDTAHSLFDLAKAYEIDLQLQINQPNSPVMAHPAALKAALYSLGYAVIQSHGESGKRRFISLSTARSSNGIVAGLYGGMPELSAAHLQNACRLYGQARQPLNQLSSGSAAGVFIANKILQAMNGRLKTSRRRGQAGLAVILPASPQLQLI
ncbi:MAG: hypothetical protein ACREGF_00675 [Candidatus Saccharimonadales bacterium]